LCIYYSSFNFWREPNFGAPKLPPTSLVYQFFATLIIHHSKTVVVEFVFPYPKFQSSIIMILYLPHFLNDFDLDVTTVKEEDWITTELQKEISSHFPDPNDIGEDRARCKGSFEIHAAELFPKGRIFASFVQLRVAVDMFLKAWGASSSHGSSRLTCFYGKPSKKPRTSVVEPDKQRVRTPSLKTRLCPFKILYSLQGLQGSEKKNSIYYHVKITTVDYEHTCELSPHSCRLALKGAGKLIPDLAGLQDVLCILREHPTLDHKVLRSLLNKYVHFYQSLDGTYIRNFRLRALNYVDSNHELTMVEARALTSKGKSSADEFVSSDNPIFAKNFKHLLQQTMQEDGDTWEALKYLRTLKEEVLGFDYRIRYDDKGRPTAICWMLPHMRTNLLRYGNVLFLDTMMKEYNDLGWPYVGPTVKDGEMKIRQVAECIAIEEKLEIYQFVLESLDDIEDRWSLSHLRLIFADQFITNTLLDNLGITLTCTLRCDYHHVVKEVWPKQFGPTRFHQLQRYLTRMLLAKTEEEYKLAFEKSMEVVEVDPLQGSYVEKIYKNPEYYSGYYLHQIEGNLKMMGSTPAEQNHSSVAAHLGNGANWTISEHVRQLIERQNTLEKSFHNHDNKLYTSCLIYRSDLTGQAKKDEELAKKNLTKYAFDILYFRARANAKELCMEQSEDGTVRLWRHYQHKESEGTVTLIPGQRCGCRERIAYQYQCCHELARDCRFNLEKYHSRWLMTRVFRHKFPLLCQMPSLPDGKDKTSSEFNIGSVLETIDCDSLAGEGHSTCQGPGFEDDASGDEEVGNLAHRKNMNYVFALSRCSQLCKTAGHDKGALASIVSLIDEATERMRQGLHITPTYSDVASIGNQAEEDQENETPRPIPSVPGHHTHPTQQKRFKSAPELARCRKRRAGSQCTVGKQVSGSVAHPEPLRNTGKRQKTCSLCYQKGHTVRHCPSLDPYQGIPLAKDDRDARSELSVSLSQPNAYASISLNSQSTVHKSLPTGVQALVIHHRMLIDSTLQNSVLPSNFCFECTILHEGGMEHERYTRKAFQLACIAKHITNNKQNIIISELKVLSAGSASLGHDAIQSYLSQQSILSQQLMTQQGEGALPIGFGFEGYRNPYP
jgi:hypothetical protein